MKALIIKDLLNLKSYFKQLVFIYGFYLVFSLMGIWDISFFVSIATMLGAMMFISTMSYDEMSKWDAFALSAPILRKDLVTSKYLLMLFSLLGSTGLSLAIAVPVLLIQNSLALIELLAYTGSVALVIMTGFSIILYLAFKVGVEKARIAMLAVFLLPTLLIFILGKNIARSGIDFSQVNLEQMLPAAAISAVIVAAAVILIMYRLSVKTVQKKEY
ncbi:ABC-2 transporter permease [Clostridium sp. MCC353]|uniref:ABC-2 transporter permease n=1 Tax=Clostridium sp. MCC353 TaxID=2592646 RepID=UPI001C01871F|nr:ABC-2 transporter permease [Clostridium sp. MCC353]MBT9778318.1 ABC-2 transporter permease [Clostridium sp. MCC353]